jgi:hypothetical protein
MRPEAVRRLVRLTSVLILLACLAFASLLD